MADSRTDSFSLDETHEFEERVVEVNRVAKVVKGGRRFSFTALMVVGDRAGRVGVGYGKAREVPMAIQKGIDEAKKNFLRIPMAGSTITHAVTGEWGGAKVLLRPAAPGTGVIAGGGVRAILECAGVRDVLGKSLGSNNAINVVRATIDQALQPRGGVEAEGSPSRRNNASSPSGGL